jgi:hypothetical protein
MHRAGGPVDIAHVSEARLRDALAKVEGFGALLARH